MRTVVASSRGGVGDELRQARGIFREYNVLYPGKGLAYSVARACPNSSNVHPIVDECYIQRKAT